MLKREIHCVHDNGLPLLRHYGASLPRGRTCTFISDVQGTTNVVVDRSRNMHKRIAFLLFFSLSFFQIYLILRAKTSRVPVYYICNHGSEWKRCWNWFFFMGQLFFQCHDYEKENFKDSFNIPFLFTQIRRAISFKETLFAKLLKLATMNIFI